MSKNIPHSLGGFRGAFESEHGRKPTEQEIWNAAIISWRDLCQPASNMLAPEQVEAAWRAGWAACRDAEYVGQEAENEAWGMSQTCANADWENAAPKQAEPIVNKSLTAPDGYKLVPVEPTQEMIAAVGVGGSGVYERLVWKQMLSATRGTP